MPSSLLLFLNFCWRLCALAVVLCFSFSSSWAQGQRVIGEIISVNYDFSIASTDLNYYNLKPGDIVEVFDQGRSITRLEVLEATTSVSTLHPLSSQEKALGKAEFKNIKVGNAVVKTTLRPPQAVSSPVPLAPTIAPAPNLPPIVEDVAKQLEELILVNQTLNAQINNLDKDKKILQDEKARALAALEEANKTIMELKSANQSLQQSSQQFANQTSLEQQKAQQLMDENKNLHSKMTFLKTRLDYVTDLV
ncbi:MAG: hypothetical protein Q7S13_02470, partial [Candidatus Omnitrophota bacterium]|nr:hypothetical protein [Candidatus Omnitrophota bacterium]